MAAKGASRLQGGADLSHRTQRVGDRAEPALGSRPCPRPWLALSDARREFQSRRAEECKARSASFQTQPGHRARETPAAVHGLSWGSRGSGGGGGESGPRGFPAPRAGARLLDAGTVGASSALSDRRATWLLGFAELLVGFGDSAKRRVRPEGAGRSFRALEVPVCKTTSKGPMTTSPSPQRSIALDWILVQSPEAQEDSDLVPFPRPDLVRAPGLWFGSLTPAAAGTAAIKVAHSAALSPLLGWGRGCG